MSTSASVPRLSPLIQALLVALLFSCVVVIPFLPSFGPAARSYVFELEMASDTPGTAQLFYEIGHGFNETDSVKTTIVAGETLRTVRLELPTGKYRQLRFDPIDRPAHLQFRDARITTSEGKVVHRFAAADFTSSYQAELTEVDPPARRVRLTTTGNDPNLAVTLAHPLSLVEERPIVSDVLKRALPVFVVLGGLVLLFEAARKRSRNAFATAAPLLTWFKAHPRRTLAMAAAIAVVASCYPVVFLGKSFVSPNFSDGTFLLYGEFPTLPGYRDAGTEDAKGSDVGAIIWQQVPYSFVQNRALLHEGELPLWNRFNSAGTVLLGQGQSMFGDPLHLPVILANGAAWAWDAKYLIARWLLCVGLGFVVLRCTRDLVAASVTVLSAAFLGFFLYRLNHPAYFSFCYAPWILFAWIRIVDAVSWRGLAGWCGLLILASVCELNSGTVKEAYMLLLGMHFSGLVVLLCAPRPWRERVVLLAVATWAGGLFAMLTAPTWLTLLDSLKQAYTSYDLAAAYQIHPSMALGFFDELFYRPLLTQARVFNPSANFVVLTGFLYFVAAFSQASAKPHGRALAWGALLPTALVFGLIPPQWIMKVPFVGNVVHIDNSFSCVLIILVTVLSGLGWSAAFRRIGTTEGRADLGRIAALYGALLFLWISTTHTVHRPGVGAAETYTFLRWGQQLPVDEFIWGSLAAYSIAIAVLLLVLRHALRRNSWSTSAVIVLIFAPVILLWREGQHTPNVGPIDYVFAPAVRADFHANSPAIAALKADQREPSRAFGLSSNLFPGWTADYQIEGLGGADALINPAFRELTIALGFERLWDWRLFVAPSGVAAMKPALDFLNVRHYADLRSDQTLLGAVLMPVKMADLDIYRSETTWPRAFFANSLALYDKPAELAEKVRQPNGRPFAALLRTDLSGQPALAALTHQEPSPVQRARDYQLSANTTAFTVDATGAGIAVLHEAWLPRSFRATLNGKPVPYLRINHAFKGVLIPAAGTYRVAFSYWPQRMTLALSLSACAVALIILSAFVLRRFRGTLLFQPSA